MDRASGWQSGASGSAAGEQPVLDGIFGGWQIVALP